jgi:hypothetical protein
VIVLCTVKDIATVAISQPITQDLTRKPIIRSKVYSLEVKSSKRKITEYRKKTNHSCSLPKEEAVKMSSLLAEDSWLKGKV